MTEIDALKYELEQQEKSYNKLHKMYVSLLKQQGELEKENEQLRKVIEENEVLIQSTYEELTKLRCIKKNLGRIKSQWDWIMEAIQYD